MTNCLTTSVTFTQITFLLSYSLRRKVICFLVALPASTSANTPAEGNQRFHLQTAHEKKKKCHDHKSQFRCEDFSSC